MSFSWQAQECVLVACFFFLSGRRTGVGLGEPVFAAVAGRCGTLVILVGARSAWSARVVDPVWGAQQRSSTSSSGAGMSSGGSSVASSGGSTSSSSGEREWG